MFEIYFFSDSVSSLTSGRTISGEKLTFNGDFSLISKNVTKRFKERNSFIINILTLYSGF